MRTATLEEIFPDHRSGYWGKDAGSRDVDARVIRNSDVLPSGAIRWDEVPTRGFTKKEMANAHVRAGDLLITTSGDCGRVSIASDIDAPTIASNFVRLLRPDAKSADPRFLWHQMRTGRFRAALEPFIRGTTIDNLSVSPAFTSVELVLPPIEEQRRIAAVLDAADALRAKRREALAKLDTLTQAIFIDMFGDPVTNARGWERVPLGNVLARIDSGKSPQCHDRPAQPGEWGVLKAGAVSYGIFRADENKALPGSVDPDPRHEVGQGDVLFSRKNTHDLVATTAYVHATRSRLLMSDLIFRLVPDPASGVEARFLQGQLAVPRMRLGVQSLAGGSSGSMPNISKSKLRKFEIVLPPPERQRDFGNRVRSVEAAIGRTQVAAERLDDLFSSLQQRAFRGEL